MFVERFGVVEAGELAVEVEADFVESFEKEAPEQARENAHREKEVRAAVGPARTVGGSASAGDDAVDVGMVEQVLAPCVKDREEADVGTEILGIAGDCK